MSDDPPDPPDGSNAPPGSGRRPGQPFAFDPVSLRARWDGWLPEKQDDFIRALAETGCVDESCRRVKMSASSAYALRARPDAQSFRLAWDAALDMAMPRMSDAAISRCIYGVPVPHFYKGEQIGEHRRYDERLTMFLLRYRDPVRYGKWLDRVEFRRHADGAALTLLDRLGELWEDAAGLLKRRRSPIGPIDVEGEPRR